MYTLHTYRNDPKQREARSGWRYVHITHTAHRTPYSPRTGLHASSTIPFNACGVLFHSGPHRSGAPERRTGAAHRNTTDWRILLFSHVIRRAAQRKETFSPQFKQSLPLFRSTIMLYEPPNKYIYSCKLNSLWHTSTLLHVIIY